VDLAKLVVGNVRLLVVGHGDAPNPEACLGVAVEEVNACAGVVSLQLVVREQADDGANAHLLGAGNPSVDDRVQFAFGPPAWTAGAGQTASDNPFDSVVHGLVRRAVWHAGAVAPGDNPPSNT